MVINVFFESWNEILPGPLLRKGVEFFTPGIGHHLGEFFLENCVCVVFFRRIIPFIYCSKWLITMVRS